jgi:hypothetical protein
MVGEPSTAYVQKGFVALFPLLDEIYTNGICPFSAKECAST